MEQHKLISLALSFTSFLIERIGVKSVILFGSVANNTFDRESDIDLFIETDKKSADKIQNLLELYEKTEEYEKFRLERIENKITTKIRNLKEWGELKRSIISNGIILYGKYQGKPDKLNHVLVFLIDTKNIRKTEKIKIWRKIYGYKQKVGKKIYVSEGLAERRLGRGAFFVSIKNSQEVKDYLKKNKIKHSFLDMWVEE